MTRHNPNHLEDIYASYLRQTNEKHVENRYAGMEHYYHASSSGMCSRKLYFQTIEKVIPTNPPNNTSTRLMRLGTLVHKDFEDAILYYNNIYNTSIDNTSIDNTSKTNITIKGESAVSSSSEGAVNSPKTSLVQFHTEGEIRLEELSVRGFYDIVEEQTAGDRAVFLYDLKTAADYTFKKLFGQVKAYENPMQHQELQVATYGCGVKEKYGRLDGMYLVYYNKNTSVMNWKQVPLPLLGTAYMFWANIKKEHAKGLPEFKQGVSPVMKWECNYCQFADHCDTPYRTAKRK